MKLTIDGFFAIISAARSLITVTVDPIHDEEDLSDEKSDIHYLTTFKPDFVQERLGKVDTKFREAFIDSSQRGNGSSEGHAPQRTPTPDCLRDSRTPGLSQRAQVPPQLPHPPCGLLG